MNMVYEYRLSKEGTKRKELFDKCLPEIKDALIKQWNEHDFDKDDICIEIGSFSVSIFASRRMLEPDDLGENFQNLLEHLYEIDGDPPSEWSR